MTVWYHLHFILSKRTRLLVAGFILLFVVFVTALFISNTSFAAPSTTKTVNFQGRLLKNSGAVVPDGNYNIQFKIYQGGTGKAAGNSGGSLKWTETYRNGGSSGGVQVKNGFFSVSLGSVNPFGSSVDWDQDTLFLSMNVAGRSASCTTFGSAPCAADGEMLPMKRITATPYSINSGAVGGKTANDLVQLGQGAQTDSSTSSSIFINKTAAGSLLRLQQNAIDIFAIDNAGSMLLGSNANKVISVADATEGSAGKSLSVLAGGGGSGAGSTGGDLVLQSGSAGGVNGDGGNVTLDAGAGTGTGTGGSVAIGSTNASSITIGSTSEAVNQDIAIGTNNTAGSTSNVTIGAGESASDGTTVVQAKGSVDIKTNGKTRATFSDTDNTVTFGNGASSDTPDDFTIQGTNSSSELLAGGSITLQGGDATTGNTDGGDVILTGGKGSGSNASGLVILSTPTFSTATSDANCYTDGATVAASCTVSSQTVNDSSGVMVGFSAKDQTATLPDPITKTAGRIIYVMAAKTSKDFTLSVNGGGDGNEVALRKNTTATMMWNGSDWSLAGTSSTTSLQDAYDSQSGTRSVRVGSGSSSDTLLTLGRSATAPTASDSDFLLGSMYYDTTLGKVQCYEAEGWGACGSTPDNFITISPEYTNAVMNGADIGTISSDLCSDSLNINDGSGGQPTVCGTDETYNFYKWTSSESSTQTRSIYVSYQLPSNFKKFVSGTTSLMGRTDSSDSQVTYQVYRDDNGAGLSSCGSAVSVSTGNKSTWQKANATGSADPASCGFKAGDSVLIRINLSASNSANAYISNLNFIFSNN